MRLLIVSPNVSLKGGISSVVNTHVQSLSKFNMTIDNYATYMGKYRNLKHVLFSITQLIKFPTAVKKCDFVHVHASYDGSFYRKAFYVYLAKLKGKKVFFHIHGSQLERFLHGNALNRWVARSLFTNSDKIIVLSEDMKRVIAGYCDRNKIAILKNPVDIPKDYRKDPTAKPKVSLLFLGEVGERKGIYDLLKAIPNLTPEIVNRLELHIGGNGDLAKLNQLIDAYKLNAVCVVHGWIAGKAKEDLLKQADIYVLPSHNEGLPVSILEAMAFRLPVISTTVGGIPEIVHHHENGILFEAGDIGQLTAAIEHFFTHPDDIATFGSNSHKLVLDYGSDKVADELVNIYNEVVSPKLERVAA